METVRSIKYYIHAPVCDWRRGPFSSIAAPVEAARLAQLKNETVNIERHVTTVVVDVISTEAP